MSRDKFNYTHGDTGSQPDTSLNFEANERPASQNFDWWWYTVIQHINGHADEFARLDSDDDGVVDAADDADTVDGKDYSDIQDWVTNNSTPSEAENADTVDGKHYSDIQDWVNNNADVPDADYADIAGDADTVDNQDWSDIKTWVNNNSDVPNADHADTAGDADKVDGQDYSDIQDWVNTQSNPPSNDFKHGVNKHEGGTISQGSLVPLGTFELAANEDLVVTQAMLTKDGFTTPCTSGIDLVIASENDSSSASKVVLSGDGSTLYADETGSPLATFSNGTSDSLVVVIALDNGHFNSGAGSDEYTFGGYIAHIE